MPVSLTNETDHTAALQQMLHVLAANPQPEHCVAPILQTLIATTGAAGACFMLFDELKTCISLGDDPFLAQPEEVENVMAEMIPGIHINFARSVFDLTSDYVIAPIMLSGWAKGALCLTLAPNTQIQDADEALLTAAVDTLTTAAQFKRLNRNQNEFTRIVSHDLRSPLTYMQGFASMMEMAGELNDKQKHFVDKILAGIAQMTAQVDNIQDAGRYDPESGFYEMSRAQCDLNEIVHKIADNHAISDDQPQLRIVVTPGRDIPIINADVNMLERAISNLVDNAIKYSPDGGTIEIGVRRTGDQLIISVRDQGVGISPENQKQLFDRHVRIPRQEHKKVKGSGLGLFIVKSVAQRHNGRAWVESAEGRGSTFFMSVPLEGDNLIGAQR